MEKDLRSLLDRSEEDREFFNGLSAGLKESLLKKDAGVFLALKKAAGEPAPPCIGEGELGSIASATEKTGTKPSDRYNQNTASSRS
ncbi:MAG: hypothetical protein IJ737_05145 [Ruminococcus sp.]|nr:hypothetical protein [Ruminococcus sp.]